MATVLVFLMSGFKSYTVSSTPTRQADIIDVTHQRQPLDAQMFPTVGKRQSRKPDIAPIEDSYIEALRHSQDSRRKSSALPVDHAHHSAHEVSSHGTTQGIHHQFNTDFSHAHPTNEYASTNRPLTAMEINYLKPKKLSPAHVAADIAPLESSDEEEELADEEQPKDEDESEARRQFVRLIRRPYYSVASANSIYSIHLANGVKLANRKNDDITTTQNTRILTKSKPMSVRLSEAMQFITHRAAGAFRKGTMGSTAGLSSTLNNVNKRANRWLPTAAAVGRRKKRSVLLNTDQEKNNKHDVKKRQSANDANKISSINNLPVRFHFKKLSPTFKRAITSAHSSDNKSTSSKLKNLKTTQFKQILPWFYSKFSKNQKRTSQEAADIEQNEKSDSGDDNVATSTSKIPSNDTNLSLHDTLSKKEGHAQVDNSKFTHGHGIIVPSDHVSTSSNVIKDTVIHGTSNDLSTYTHGHGIVIPNALVHDKPLGESSLVSDVVDNQNILSLLVNGTTSSNVVEGHDDVETTENISLLDPLIASLDGPVLTTGVFSDEIDLALDDLESLMTDIIIAPLQVQAVVAEDDSSSDAVIIEAAESNQPDSIPVVSNLANIFIAPSGSSVSSSSSSSSGSISSGGIVGDSSTVPADPFALLNTIGLATIGIFVLTLPIWVPFVVARMKKRRNSFSRRSPFVFPIGSFNSDAQFHPYSTLLQKLTPPDASLNNPGPLNSEEVYGPASPSYFGRNAIRRRRSNRRNTFQP